MYEFSTHAGLAILVLKIQPTLLVTSLLYNNYYCIVLKIFQC